MREAFIEAGSGFAARRKALLLYERAVSSSATLRGREQDRQVEDVHTIAKAIAARSGLDKPDERRSLLAAVGLLAYRRALGRWLLGPASGEFADSVADEFDLLEGLFRSS
jgi:DNA-binding IclR family transcriptional regulator